MYTLCSNFVKYLKKQSDPDDVAYVMIGLNNAGKTTIASALQGELVENTRPTIGFKRKTYQADGFNLTVFDLGGKMQRIWKEYVAEVHGAIFVIDAADSDRLDEAKAALKTITEDPRFKGKPVIIYANKQDLPAALKADELAERLGLDAPDMQVTRYNIVACTALALDGAPDSVDPRLWEGMQWLNESSRKTWKAMSERVKEQMKEQDEERKVAALKRKADAAASRAARQLEREEEARQAAAKAADAERARLTLYAPSCAMLTGILPRCLVCGRSSI